MDTSIMFPSMDANLVSSNGQPAVIKVIGVGGGGSNAVDRMIQAGVHGVEFAVINTDLQALSGSLAETKIQIGETISRGLGVGANPEIGRKSAEENIEGLKDAVKGADMLFITAGMGGGTGTGAAPVLAQIARDMNILTVGVVTKPFLLEGQIRMRQAEEGIINIGKYTDTLIVIPNDRVFNAISIDNKGSSKPFYQIIDDVLRQSIQAITDIITKKGEINRDLADVRTTLKNAGPALIGMGESSKNVQEAIDRALTNPLLDNLNISKANKMIINLTTGPEYNRALEELNVIISGYKMKNALILFGQVIDKTIDKKIKVTVVATGFNNHHKGMTADITRTSHITIKANPQIQLSNASNDELSFNRPLEKATSDYFLKPAFDNWQPRKLNK